MAATTPRASRALRFMQHCRQTSHNGQVGTTRHSSTFKSQIEYTSAGPKSPYDPSNFSRPLPTPPSLTRAKEMMYHHPRAQQPITEVRYPNIRPSLWTAIKSIFGWKPPAPRDFNPAPFNVSNNPYRARKQWPPDFRDLHPKQQFHFEKTYRRRAKLAYARPVWNRRVRLAQHSIVVLTLIYFIFFAEPKDMGTPFDGFRVWFFGKLKSMTTLPDSTREAFAESEVRARQIKEERAGWRWWGRVEVPEKEEAQGEAEPETDATAEKRT